MAQTMRRITNNLAMGLLLMASCGTLHAQVNPATVKNQAQNGINQAQQTHPKSSTQNAKQGTAAQSKTTAKVPVTSTTQGMKQSAANTQQQGSATQQPPKKPAASSTSPQNQKVAPKKPATSKTPAGTPATTSGTQAKQAQSKTPVKPPAKAPAPVASKPTPPPVRRDPFVTLISKNKSGGAEPVHLPPGKAGLQVSTLVIQGILSSPSGMIAVVANPQKSVYFLHAGDELFDGKVEKIEIDGITFHEVGKDAFGKPLERSVTRKLNPSLGEQP